jgi:hypothetical protein
MQSALLELCLKIKTLGNKYIFVGEQTAHLHIMLINATFVHNIKQCFESNVVIKHFSF